MARKDRASTAEHTTDAPPSRTDTEPSERVPSAPRPAGDLTDALPDGIDPQPYIEIRPADATLDPGAAETAMRRLATALRERESSGLGATLTRSVTVPRVELLLVADGAPDASLRYLVGTYPVDDDLRETVRSALRTALPRETDLATTTFHPLAVREYCRRPARSDAAGTDDARATGAPYAAGVEWIAEADERRDWMTPLAAGPERIGDTAWQPPVADVAEILADASVPAIYQVVLRATRDWRDEGALYAEELREGSARLLDQLIAGVVDPEGQYDDDFEPSTVDQRRIDAVGAREADATVTVSARAVALTQTDPGRADTTATTLASALTPLSGRFHRVSGVVRTDSDRGRVGRALANLPWRDGLSPGAQVYADLVGAVAYPPEYATLWSLLPVTDASSRGIVAAPDECPGLWLAGGADLPPASRRALGAQRPERTGLALPPPAVLARYRGDGWPLGRPVDADRRAGDEPIVLPPDLQPLHLLVVGATGSGKSTALTSGLLANHEATDGPAILLDAKGGGMAQDYLRAHYARHGDLDDVIYLNCEDALPALGVFDIRPLIDAGVSREEARSRVAGHYEEILGGVMGPERFGSAVRSPTVIRNHLRALFDPVHGADAVAHRDLVDALRRTQQDGEPPAVVDPGLEGYFESLLDSEPRVFSQVLGGALARVETIATDGRLAPLFDHVPERDEAATQDDSEAGEATGAASGDAQSPDETASDPEAAPESAPRFTMRDVLNEDRVVVIDFGGLEDSVKDALTLVLLAELWTALKARNEHDGSATDQSLVNLYLEDAGSVAGTELVDTLLSQGRSFGLSVTLGVQYPGQLATSDPERDTYREALNETATILAGNVGVDDDLARLLATEEQPPAQLARRLASLGRGEWLCRPAAAFGEAPPAPFLVESLDPPAGHPAAGDDPPAGYPTAFARCTERSAARYGLRQSEVSSVDGAAEDESDADTATAAETDGDATASAPSHAQLTTTLPHTQRLPSCVGYDERKTALRCTRCDTLHNADDAGMRRAVECCTGLEAVDRDDIPVVRANLKLGPEAVADAPWSVTQLIFLQLVYDAQQGRCDPPGYDLLHDSMIRLREYAGIDPDDIVDLVDAGLLREDGDHPHRLYSVTPDGREAISESWREGVDYGDGAGDMTESSQHRLAVEVGRRLIDQAYAADPDSQVERVKPYHEVDIDGEMVRLDYAGLDADGDVVVALEAERINHDVDEAVPSDFDKMAACDPAEAIWVVLTRTDAHRVVEALRDPSDGQPRVEKTYSQNTPAHKFRYETPGCTRMYTVRHLRDTVLPGTDD